MFIGKWKFVSTRVLGGIYFCICVICRFMGLCKNLGRIECMWSACEVIIMCACMRIKVV